MIEIPGWETRGHGGMIAVKTVVCHHTAGKGDGDWNPLNDDYPSLRVVRDGRPGLDGPLAQYGIGRNTGTIYVISAGCCWHAGEVLTEDEANHYAIGIEAENDGLGEPWGVEMRTSYALLCKELIKEFGLSVSRVLGHKEVCSPPGRKSDPSFNMAAFRADVSQAALPPVEVPPEIIVEKGTAEMFTIQNFDGTTKYLITGEGYRRRIYDPEEAHVYASVGVADAGKRLASVIGLFPEQINLAGLLADTQAEVLSAVAQAAKAGGTPEEIGAATVSILTARLAKASTDAKPAPVT